MRTGLHLLGKDAVSGTRPGARRLGLILASLLAWQLLGYWLISGSERFFLLVPPVVLTMVLTRTHKYWPSRRRVLVALLGLASLALACVAYNLVVAAPLFPVENGFWRGLSIGEAAFAVYFVLALFLLATLTRRALRPPLIGLLDRWLPLLPRGKSLAQVIAAEGIVLAGLAPFLVVAFHVHRFKVPNPERPSVRIGRMVEDIVLETADGLTLRGWFVPAEAPSSVTLLICHGMGTNRTEVFPYTAVGDVLRANVLLFDFRGHGESDGHTISFGYHEKRDVEAAIGYLRNQRPDQAREIIALGISMGTAGLIRAAADLDPPLDAIILDSGFAVAVELTDHLVGDLPLLLRPCLTAAAIPLASLDAGCWLPELRPVDAMPRLRAPVLIIHARDDRLIPASHAWRLYEAVSGPRECWIAVTGDHGSAFVARTEYLQRVGRFFEAQGILRPSGSNGAPSGVSRRFRPLSGG